MKNRRILSHPELEPKQIRGVDPFCDFDSDICNRLTKISHRTDQPDVIIDGLDVVENCENNVEYLSQELVNYDKFEYYENCHRVVDVIDEKSIFTKELQVYIIDGDIQEIKKGYIEQDLSTSERLNLRRFFNTDIVQTFAVSFSISQGTPKNVFISIGDSVLDFKYLDGAYDEKSNKYTAFIDVNFKNISRKLIFKAGAYIDTSDHRNFYSHDDINGASFITISDLSCKMIIRDKSNEIPFYANNNWNYNHCRCIKKLKVTEGTAVKDNVVINSLRSVNLGNSAVTLDLSDPKSWIHNNPYTLHDFYGKKPEIFNIKTNIYNSNSNLEIISSTIDTDNNLKVTIKNTKSNVSKVYNLNDFNNITTNYLSFEKESEDDEYVVFKTFSKAIENDFNSDTIIVSYNNIILTKIDLILTSIWCPQFTFKVSKKDIEKYHITKYSDIKVSLCDAVVKVAEDSKHVLWGYVVCYYNYYKNPNPNPCYIGLIREDEYLKDGFTEDYLILAKVRFVDPNTIDIIQYLDNRNNYETLTSRNVNYIVNFDYDDIWYSKNPVNVTDAINYCQVLRNNVLKQFKLKHNYQQPVSTSYRLLNKDAKIDVKGRISVDLQTDNRKTYDHLQRRIAPNTRKLIVTNLFYNILGITDEERVFNWDIIKGKWITPTKKWAISADFGLFGLYSESTNTIYTKYFGFNETGPFKFMDPRSGELVIELDWQYSNLKSVTAPSSIDEYDISRDEDLLLSYYPKEHKDLDPKYISDLDNEALNSKHNHFSYLVFRKQLLSKKYLVKMLDLLPKTPEYLIDGRITKCIDGHIQSSIHELSTTLTNKNLINCDIVKAGEHDIIKSTTYWLSTNNFDTKGTEKSKLTPKKFQDNQLLLSKDGEIQSSNYAIDDLDSGYILTTTTDENGIIHIKSTDIIFSAYMVNNNMVIAEDRFDPDYRYIGTNKYYISTTNRKTIDARKDKLLQDQQLISAKKDSSSRTCLESSNVIIYESLLPKHVVISQKDINQITYLMSSKAIIDNTLINNNLVIARDVTSDSETIDTSNYYNISTKNYKTKGSEDKPLQTGHILVSDGLSMKTIQSSNVIIDLNNPSDSNNHQFVKISKTDSEGVVHITNSDEIIDELSHELCYMPNNIRIRDGKVHITIDCKKKFRLTTSQLLKAIQSDPAYNTIFNYDISIINTKLFTLVVHVDVSNTKTDKLDRTISNDNNFKTVSNYYESQLLFINDINLNEVTKHITTEDGKSITTEGGESKKYLALESYKFRSYINVEYSIVNSDTEGNEIQWIDEYRGYDDGVNGYNIDPSKPHIIGEADSVDYIITAYDLDYARDIDIDEFECDSIDDFEYETEDIGKPEEVEDITIPSSYKTENISITDVEDVDDIKFLSFDVSRDRTKDISVYDFETGDIEVDDFETKDAEYGGEAVEVYESDAEDIDISALDASAPEIGKAENVSLHRLHQAKNLIFDLSSFLGLYPMFLRFDRWAKLISSNHGYGEARGPVNQFFAQTKSCINFKLVKNKSESVGDIVPGITFNSETPEDIVYASSLSYNIEL